MNPMQVMEIHKPHFTPNDQLIYDGILKNPAQVVYRTTVQLAEECGVSQPALTRFVKGLGYSRYQDFRADFIAWQAQDGATEPLQTGYFSMMHQLLQETEKLLTPAYLRDLADYIGQFSRLFATGTAKSYQPAELLEILMRKYRLDVHAVGRDYLGSLADCMDATDLLIVFSTSAGSYIRQNLAYSSGKLLLVTANPRHGYDDLADRVVVLPYIPPDPETSAVSPILFAIFVELLAPYLAKTMSGGQKALAAPNAR